MLRIQSGDMPRITRGKTTPKDVYRLVDFVDKNALTAHTVDNHHFIPKNTLSLSVRYLH